MHYFPSEVSIDVIVIVKIYPSSCSNTFLGLVVGYEDLIDSCDFYTWFSFVLSEESY